MIYLYNAFGVLGAEVFVVDSLLMTPDADQK